MTVAGPGVGVGRAFGAVTIVNATATGIGCALAVRGGAEATWTPRDGAVRLEDGPDARLAEAVALACADLTGQRGADVAVRCASPPARGLKTSSSVAAALVRAAADAAGRRLPDLEVAQRAVAASRQAGVTLTGAFDDQAATVLGGCHLTDNARQAVLLSPPAQPWAVAVWVPQASIPKERLRDVDVASAKAGAAQAARLAQAGRLAEAMTANGRAFHAVYAAAGLPVDERPAEVALAHGALGAGLSGTGPAVAALFTSAVDLPAVPGGEWRWTEAVP